MSDKSPKNTLSSVGIIAWWSETFELSTKDLLGFILVFNSFIHTFEYSLVFTAFILSFRVSTISSVRYLESVLG